MYPTVSQNILLEVKYPLRVSLSLSLSLSHYICLLIFTHFPASSRSSFILISRQFFLLNYLIFSPSLLLHPLSLPPSTPLLTFLYPTVSLTPPSHSLSSPPSNFPSPFLFSLCLSVSPTEALFPTINKHASCPHCHYTTPSYDRLWL